MVDGADNDYDYYSQVPNVQQLIENVAVKMRDGARLGLPADNTQRGIDLEIDIFFASTSTAAWFGCERRRGRLSQWFTTLCLSEDDDRGQRRWRRRR
jgi:hypothetical protein